MATPTYTLEYAATAGPLDASPTWTTISSDDVLSVNIATGRQSETDRSTQPSTMTVRLDNRARTYDPETNSNLTPSTQVRLTATHNAVDTVMFRGVVNIDGWQQVDYQHPDTSSCVIVCLDLLGHVAQRATPYRLFESRLQQIAVDAGLAISQYRHTPLGDDSSDDYYGTITYWPEQQFHGQQTQPSYAAQAVGGLTIEALPSTCYSAIEVRPGRPGALDGWLGCAVLRSERGWQNRSDGVYAEHSHGFTVRVNSLPAEDRAHLEAHNSTSTASGVFLNRDGTLTVSLDGTTDNTSTNIIEPGGTYHITVTWDGTAGGSLGKLRCYVNGAVWVTTDAHVTVTTGFNGLLYYLGAQPVGLTPLVDALYVDAWFMNENTITAAEASQLYDLWAGNDGVPTGRAAGQLCDAIGLPHTITATAGRLSVTANSDDRVDISAALQDIERTERGRIYYSHRDEQVAMVTWSDLVTGTRHTTTQLKLSDDAAETGTFLRYSNPQVVTLQPITRADVTAGGFAADWSSTTATDSYGEQTISYSAVSGSDYDAFSLATTEVYRNSSPVTAVRSLTVEPISTADYTAALDLELFDQVELTRRPHNTGTQQTIDAIVEGISYSIGVGVNDWVMTLFLTRVSDDVVGVWGTVQFGNTSNGRVEA